MLPVTSVSDQGQRRFRLSVRDIPKLSTDHMRSLANRSLFVSAISVVVACHSAPPPPPVAPPVPLSDSATSAVQWVQGHAQQFSVADSIPSSAERARIVALAGNAQIIGVSELTEGTRELPMIIRHL